MVKTNRIIMNFSKRSQPGTLLKVVDIAAKAGVSIMSAGSPVADAVYEISKTGLGKIREYIHLRDDRRILEFHERLLFNEGVIDENTLKGQLEEANFHALMQACLSDIEDEKTVPYALLTRSIACGTVQQELRRHFILALKDLAWDHLDFLRKAYVLSKNSIIPPQGPGALEAQTILTGYAPGSVDHLAVVNLTSKGFVAGLELSQLGINFVESCSAEDDLAPGAYGLQVWSGYKCDIIFLDQSSSFMQSIDAVQAALRGKGISCGSGTAMEGALNRRDSNLYANCAVVIFRRGKTLDQDRLENLKYRVQNKPAVQIVLDFDGDDTPESLIEAESVVISGGDITSSADLIVERLIARINSGRG